MLFQVSIPDASEGHVLPACRGKDLSHLFERQVLSAASISASSIISLVVVVKVGQRGPLWNVPIPNPNSKQARRALVCVVEAGTDGKDSRGREGKHMVMFTY